MWTCIGRIYISICASQDLDILKTQIITCIRCREFLKELYNFKNEYNAVDLAVQHLEVDINQFGVYCDTKNLQKIAEMLPESFLGSNIVNSKNQLRYLTSSDENGLVIERSNRNIHYPDDQAKDMLIKPIIQRSPNLFKCSECSYTTKQMKNLKSHVILKHSNEKPYECDHCGYRAKTKNYMYVHLKSHCNNRWKPFKCNECSFCTTGISKLKIHVKCKHSDKKPFACDQCNYRGKIKRSLTLHKRIHINNDEDLLKCSDCSYRAINMRNLRSHAALKHRNDELFECDLCGYRTKTKAYISVHIKRHLNEGLKPFKCKECSYTSMTMSRMNVHATCKHREEKLFSCDQCDYRAKIKRNLTLHKKSHFNGGVNPFKCGECAYTTSNKWNLKCHIAVKHSKRRPFQCDLCGYRAKTKSYLSAHTKTHLKNCVQFYKCGECSYKANTMGELKSHTTIEHSSPSTSAII